jgi:hypothetical protein
MAEMTRNGKVKEVPLLQIGEHLAAGWVAVAHIEGGIKTPLGWANEGLYMPSAEPVYQSQPPIGEQGE